MGFCVSGQRNLSSRGFILKNLECQTDMNQKTPKGAPKHRDTTTKNFFAILGHCLSPVVVMTVLGTLCDSGISQQRLSMFEPTSCINQLA